MSYNTSCNTLLLTAHFPSDRVPPFDASDDNLDGHGNEAYHGASDCHGPLDVALGHV